jgi:3-hydroxyanthranilate 3,4-dioxygenase
MPGMPETPPPAQTLRAFNFRRWIDEHRHLLKPPVGNKLVFRDTEFIIMVVGGPNSRSDFHVDPAEEFFYQLEGDMVLRTVQPDASGKAQLVDIDIREGDILLLPAGVPHSPQRKPDTVGLVVERRRRPGEQDGLQWYCDSCASLLYEEFFPLTNIETQFPPVFARFYENLAHRTCRTCGTVAPVPAPRGPNADGA